MAVIAIVVLFWLVLLFSCRSYFEIKARLQWQRATAASIHELVSYWKCRHWHIVSAPSHPLSLVLIPKWSQCEQHLYTVHRYTREIPDLVYRAPSNGIVSHRAQIGGIRVFANHTRKTNTKQMRPWSLHSVQHFNACLSSRSDRSRCRWHTYLTNHGYSDHGKTLNTPIWALLHSGIKMAQVLGSPLYICGKVCTFFSKDSTQSNGFTFSIGMKIKSCKLYFIFLPLGSRYISILAIISLIQKLRVICENYELGVYSQVKEK